MGHRDKMLLLRPPLYCASIFFCPRFGCWVCCCCKAINHDKTFFFVFLEPPFLFLAQPPPPSLPSSSLILKLAPIFRWKVNFWKITFPFGGQIWYFTLASKAQAEFRLEKEELRLSRRGKRGKTFEGINFLHALLSFHHQSSSSSSRVEVVFERLKLFCFRFPIVSSTATIVVVCVCFWKRPKIEATLKFGEGLAASEASWPPRLLPVYKYEKSSHII